MRRIALLCLAVGLLCLHDRPPTAQGRQVAEAAVKQVQEPPRVQAGLPGFPGAPQLRLDGQAVATDSKELVAALLESLKDRETDVRKTAAATLVHLGHEAVPALQEQLKAKEGETRANAAYLLGQIGSPAQVAMPALLRALKDEDREVRRRAAFAVHRIVRDTRGGAAGMMAPGMPGMMGGGMRAASGSGNMNVPDPGLLTARESAEPQLKK
jgi:hypothetical protein